MKKQTKQKGKLSPLGQLKKFYYEEFYMRGMPKFDSLNEKQLRNLMYGTPFSNWKLKKAIENLQKLLIEKLISCLETKVK